jgi:hypothetical protein
MQTTSTTEQQTTNELGGTEAAAIRQQLERGDLSQLRQLLATTRQKRDWQDRYFMLDLVVPSVQPGALSAACAAEPNAADLALIHGVHLYDMVAKSRGAKVAASTSKEQFHQAFSYVQQAVPVFQKATALDPEDPTAHAFAMRMLQISSEFSPALNKAYQKAIQLAPDFLPAHWVMVNARSQKWSGSHQESLRIARSALANAKPGSDLAACLFLARILEWQYAVFFDKDVKRANALLQDRALSNDLSTAFDHWTQPPYQARRSSVPYLLHAAFWFYKTGDRDRLARVFSFTGGVFYDRAWSFAGKARENHAAALELATKKKTGFLGFFKS